MKIVFLGIDRKYSIEASYILRKMDCEVLVSHTKQAKFYDFPAHYDLGIALGYTHLVPKIELEKSIWVNIHPAPLPDYGGRNIAYHAILNGESHFGATLHYMNEYFDRGDVLAVERFKIPEGTTANELYDMACTTSLKLLRQYIPKLLERKTIRSEKQNNHRYYTRQAISNFIDVNDFIKRNICALYYPPNFPRIRIGERNFKIVLEEDDAGSSGTPKKR
jgi:methionyl-tRNA formyltransferase